MDDLLQEFIAETRETLEALAGEIVAWEADPTDRARLDAIFRFVHTVKGSCGFLDLPRLARLSHAAEDVLAAVRAGTRVADPALVNAVLAIVDRIGEIVEAIDAGAALDDSGEDQLLAALDGAPAAVAATAKDATATVTRSATRSVRLSVDLLDRLMSGVSEVVLARNELSRRLRETGDPSLEATVMRLTQSVAELRDTISRTRMQTVDALFSALPRVVRDTATALGKQVTLAIEGGDVELDREVIEVLRDPLVHMVRNAIDHGIEAPAERRAAGKRESGRLSIAARQSGNRIIVEIADDGRGIDTARLVDKLAVQEPARAAALRALDERARADLIFEPGLSSRDEATAVSGRGVGMDVVRANVEQVGGRIALANVPGAGLVVTIEVPLTLAILSAVIVESAGMRFALPRQAIDEILAADAAAVRFDRVGDAPIVAVRERRLPYVALDGMIGGHEMPAAYLVIVDVPGGSYALGFDRIADTEELVVKPAAPAVMAAGIYAGQTLPDSGLPLLLLDCGGIADRAGLIFVRADDVEDEAAAPEAAVATPALLFDDLDGERRAIVLAAVERVDTVASGAIRHAAGRWWLMADGAMVPLAGAIGGGDPTQARHALRLRGDHGAIAYAVTGVAEIVDLPPVLAPGNAAGAVTGVALIEGDPIELIDPLWLLAQAPAGRATDTPLCLLHGSESAWMADFLRPAIERAGYRVVASLPAGTEAALTLAMEDDAAPPGPRIIRLSRTPGDTLYRYDHEAVMAAVRQEGRR